MAKWILKKNNANTSDISESLGISEIVAALIVNRGIKRYEDAVAFLRPDVSKLPDPFGITDMRTAVEKLAYHVESRSKIAVFSDYDVDGVMSAVILSKALKGIGADFRRYVPDREKDGYGLNEKIVRQMHSDGINLIITCDNGITAINESHLIYELGMCLIIIDHHEPSYNELREDILPLAEAIINPKRRDCLYPFKLMCAAGLCFRFTQALYELAETPLPEPDELLIFAAIATVCDIVDLLGDNRAIVKSGLSIISETKNPGLRELINIYELKNISAYHIGFIIGPAINASGRLGSASLAIKLFLTEDESEAQRIAKELYELNLSRQALTEAAHKKVEEALINEDLTAQKIFVIYSGDVHESLAGIVAGRIKDKYYHPTLLITNGDNYAKGSARSIDKYNIFDALSEVSHLLVKYGGHSQAAGFTIEKENIELFRKLLNSNCFLAENDFVPVIYIDKQLHLEQISFSLCDDLESMRPFGKGNREPIFAEKNVRFSKVDLIGKNKNVLKFQFSGFPMLQAISFDLYEKFMSFAGERFGISSPRDLCALKNFEMDIVFTVSKNEYKGLCSLQLILKDFR